ncbi:MAG: arginine decarboxylase, partial [Candidatus Saccharimonas sp.]|nr:arginine decarboxylase [Planctomycetaceae bacterium]
GSYHNLFGQPNEAQVVIDNDGRYHVTKLVHGSRIQDMMQFARYDKAQLVESYRKQLAARVEAGSLTQETADQLAAEYEAGAARGTYLE